MADDADVTDDTSNVTDDDNDNGQDTTVADTDDVETLKEQLAQKDKQNVKLFARLKKEQGFEQQPDGSWVKVVKKPEIKSEPKPVEVARTEAGLTPMDTIALISAKVTEKEDIEFVAEYAQFKKISVAEALKSGVVKTELAQRIEQRQTAEATNTGAARRGSTKPSDEQVLRDAGEGKLPDDPVELAKARHAAKLKK